MVRTRRRPGARRRSVWCAGQTERACRPCPAATRSAVTTLLCLSSSCPSSGRVSKMLCPHNSDGCSPEASSPQVYHVQSQGAKNQTKPAQSGARSQGNCQGGPLWGTSQVSVRIQYQQQQQQQQHILLGIKLLLFFSLWWNKTFLKGIIYIKYSRSLICLLRKLH